MSAFDALVRPALVRITAPGDGYDPHGDRFWGTGFFIAPGWVLTCAHVVAKGGSAVWRREAAVGITWAGGETVGRVALAKPRPATPEDRLDTWHFPDLALVRVEGADHAPCVRIGDRPPVTEAPVRLYGYAHQTGELGLRIETGETSGFSNKALLLRWSLPVEGCSGGPVVDVRRGAVIGVSKGSNAREGAAAPLTLLRELFDQPGGELLHEVLRAHDRHHFTAQTGSGNTWVDAETRAWPATARGVNPVQRNQLYGHLAELPPPTSSGEVMALVDEVKDRVTEDEFQDVLETEAKAWTDGVVRLHQLHATQQPSGAEAGDLGIDAVLLYAAHLARHLTERYGADPDVAPAVRALSDWTRNESGHARARIRKDIVALLDPAAPRPGASPGGEPRARADVRIEIDAVPYSDPPRYTWQVLLLFDGRTMNAVRAGTEGLRPAELEQALRGPLAQALGLGDKGEHLAGVEAVLPRELFDLPIDTWRLAPDDEPFGEGSLPLGRRRTVVIRDRHRGHRGPFPEWRQRWRGCQSGPLRAVPLRAEVLAPGTEDGHAPNRRKESQNAVYARLREVEGGSVPVYCGPVGSGDGQRAMEAALAAGHPVALWRHSAREHADCAEFHKRAGELFAVVDAADGLHGPVRALRLRAGDTEADPRDRAEHAWAEGLAVLYDPPDRPPHDAPLQGPLLLGEDDPGGDR
ncbi:trypsin-like peptidase domain-containing protein [Streptomyces sp. NPDC004267]|uniref:VMAP-C domain-containing protein n=1 Tax=Streptomyces sp. NPDC004267 TaxID=3364694 RepID=UPI0036965C09